MQTLFSDYSFYNNQTHGKPLLTQRRDENDVDQLEKFIDKKERVELEWEQTDLRYDEEEE